MKTAFQNNAMTVLNGSLGFVQFKRVKLKLFSPLAEAEG